MIDPSETIVEYLQSLQGSKRHRLSIANHGEISSVSLPVGRPGAQRPDGCSHAEFFRLVGRHKLHVFRETEITHTWDTANVVGVDGAYASRWSELQDLLTVDYQGLGADPFILKNHPEVFGRRRPIVLHNLESGTVIVSKYVNTQGHCKTTDPTSYLSPLLTEALVLSHPSIRRLLCFPSFLGFGVRESKSTENGAAVQYPFALLDMGIDGNLEDWFRGMWRAQVDQQDANSPRPRVILDWKRKIQMATSVAKALAALHKAGVVHGDLKLTSVVGIPSNDPEHPEDQLLQLCGLESCVLLSDTQVAPLGKSTLVSHSPPWNAPESNSALDILGLVKTDVYSFGLLLARILLDGNDPFNENYDIMSGKAASHDLQWIEKLKTEDSVVAHVMEQIQKPVHALAAMEEMSPRHERKPTLPDSCTFTPAQCAVIQNLMKATLATSPSERISDMNILVDYLGKALSPEDQNLSSLIDIDLKKEGLKNQRTLFKNDAHWVRRDSRILGPKIAGPQRLPLPPRMSNRETESVADVILSDNFDGAKIENFQNTNSLRWADEGRAIPNLLDPTFFYLLQGNMLTTDMFRELKAMAEAGSAEACHQVAWCYDNGWGVRPDEEQFRLYYHKATGGGCVSAIENFPLILARQLEFPIRSPETPPELQAKLFGTQKYKEALGERFCRHPDLSLAAFLETNFPDYFTFLIGALRETVGEHPGLDATMSPDCPLLRESLWPLKIYCLTGNTEAVEAEVQTMRLHTEEAEMTRLLSALLLVACARGHAFLAMLLLEEGADPTATDGASRTPLHFLARFDHDMVGNVGTLLLAEGARMDAQDDDGLVPLAFVLDSEKNLLPASVHVAARFLVDSGALAGDLGGQAATLPFIKAVTSGDSRLLKLFEGLLPAAEPGTRGYRLGEISFAISIANALHVVLQESRALRTRKIGAWNHHRLDPDIGITSEDPGLDYAIYSLMRRLPTDLWVASLVSSRAVDILKNVGSIDTWKPTSMGYFMWLCEVGDVGMALQYLRLGARFDAVDEDGESVLHVAGREGWSVDVVEALWASQQDSLDLSALINLLTPKSRCNAFDLAVLNGNFEFADFFQALGADSHSAHLIIPKEESVGETLRNSKLFRLFGTETTLFGMALFLRVIGMISEDQVFHYVLGLEPSPVVQPDTNLNVFHLVLMSTTLLTPADNGTENCSGEKNDFHLNNRLFDVLLSHFTDRSLLEIAETHSGYTPLHYAVESGNTQAVSRLAELGVSVNVADGNGNSPGNFVCDGAGP